MNKSSATMKNNGTRIENSTRHRKKRSRRYSSYTRTIVNGADDVDKETRRKMLSERLLRACKGTYRGALFFGANEEDKKEIELCRRDVEEFDFIKEIDFGKLDGKWELMYTTALDVTGLLVLSIPRPLAILPPAPIIVGDIFQIFNTRTNEIVNEIHCTVPFVLEEKNGITLRVNAIYEQKGPRALSLVFQEAVVNELRISELSETILAPAILPRTELSKDALLFLRDFELRFPLFGRAAQAIGGGDSSPIRGAAVGQYEFSYCDEDILIGRATGSGGLFIFRRAAV